MLGYAELLIFAEVTEYGLLVFTGVAAELNAAMFTKTNKAIIKVTKAVLIDNINPKISCYY